jgi:RIO kinase 1
MSTEDFLEFFDELDDNEQTHKILGGAQRPPRKSSRHPKRLPDEVLQFVRKQDDSRSNFRFTYKAARFESWWLLDSLGEFYEHKWISDVLRRVKGGKEASVYLCRGAPAAATELIAAKVYRPRSLRNLHNDHLYRAGRADLDEEGKQVLDDGMLHAMEKKTEYGRDLLHQSWIAYEFTSLQALHTAGADVPLPYEMAHNAILMEYIGDIDGPAPALSEVRLDPDEVKPLYERVVWNIDLLLRHDRIHGDLSAYNILYWEGAIRLIDFPQVVAPEGNPAGWGIFERDVQRVCQYFNAQGLRVDARKLAADLWTAHGHRIEMPVHPRHLDPEDSDARRVWERQQKADR